MSFPQIPIEYSLFVGRSRASLREIKFSCRNFRIDPDTGRVEYEKHITTHYEHGRELPSDAASMFHVARDLMASVYSVIEAELVSDPESKFFFDSYGRLVRVEMLSQIFLMEIPWPSGK